jgi:hypothetical protein
MVQSVGMSSRGVYLPWELRGKEKRKSKAASRRDAGTQRRAELNARAMCRRRHSFRTITGFLSLCVFASLREMVFGLGSKGNRKSKPDFVMGLLFRHEFAAEPLPRNSPSIIPPFSAPLRLCGERLLFCRGKGARGKGQGARKSLSLKRLRDGLVVSVRIRGRAAPTKLSKHYPAFLCAFAPLR